MASLEMALIFGLILTLIQYHVGRMRSFYLRHRRALSTFSAGIVLSYLVFHLLPAVYQVQGRLSKVVYLSVLGGVTLVFVLDRHINRHRVKYRIRSEMKEAHAVLLFVYHILIGIAFITFSQSFLGLLLFFIPVSLFAAFSSISMKEIYEIEGESGFARSILAASAFIGMLLAALIPVSRLLYFPLLGFIGGSVLYVALNDVFREPERKGGFFFWGIFSYSAFTILAWTVF